MREEKVCGGWAIVNKRESGTRKAQDGWNSRSCRNFYNPVKTHPFVARVLRGLERVLGGEWHDGDNIVKDSSVFEDHFDCCVENGLQEDKKGSKKDMIMT